MADPNPTFNEDIRNGARFAAALINQGTKALKAEFDKQVSSKFNNLEEAIQDRTIRNAINKLRFITKPQKKLLYPGPGNKAAENSNGFDMTLLSLLLLNILPRYEGSLTQEENDIKALRTLRNEAYGHIVFTGISDNDFSQKWNKLSHILQNFNIPSADLDKWKYESLSPDLEQELERCEKEIKTQCDYDVTFRDEFLKIIKEVIQKSGGEVLDIMRKLEGEVKSSVNQISDLLSKLPSAISKRMFEEFNSVQQELLNGLNTIKEMIGEGKEEVKVKLDTIEVKLDEGNKDVKEELGGKLNQMEKTVKDVCNQGKEELNLKLNSMDGKLDQGNKEVKEELGGKLNQMEKTVKDVCDQGKGELKVKLDTMDGKLDQILQNAEKQKDNLPGTSMATKLLKENSPEDNLKKLQENTIELWSKVCPIPDFGKKFEFEYVLDFSTGYVMLPEFTAKRRKQQPPGVKVGSDYVEWKPVPKLEDIFKYSADCKFVLLMADSGCGKTTLCQHQAYKWAKNATSLDGFVLFIPLRHVSHLTTLQEMVQHCYKDIEINVSDLLDQYKGCIVFDGLEEVILPADSEVLRLLKRQDMLCDNVLYKHLKIVVTTRPYTSKIEQLGVSADAQIILTGVTKESREKFLESFFPKKKHLHHMLGQCTQLDISSDLLNVPIYLVLVCILFHEHIASKQALTNFNIPTTKTQLFNAFLKVFLQIYQHKMEQEIQTNFLNSPLEVGSSVPNDMKLFLQALGKLCFNSIKNEKYEFTTSDFDQNFLDTDKIKKLGIFMESYGNDEQFLMRQKMFTEYFAGLYLAHEDSSIAILRDNDCILDNNVNDDDYWSVYNSFIEPKGSFSVNMGKFQNVAMFAAGMSQRFMKALVGAAQQHCKLYPHDFLEAFVIELFHEHHGHSDTTDTTFLLGNFLKEMPIHRPRYCTLFIDITGPSIILDSMVKDLYISDLKVIAKQFFGITMSESQDCKLSELEGEQLMCDKTDMKRCYKHGPLYLSLDKYLKTKE